MNLKLPILQIEKIDSRYSALAEKTCCLSCGGAIDLAKPLLGEVCIDMGSGRGTDVIRMAQAVGKDGFAYGIDTSKGMLSKAKATATKLGVTNVEFIDTVFENLPLPEKIADLVISNCSINHSHDKDLVWQQIFRVLKPGGRFVVSDIFALEPVPSIYKNDPEAVAQCWAGAVTKDVYLNSLETAGFNAIEISEESFPYEKGEIKVCSFTISGKRPK
jgi:ubiquinone/menaquinone biosynthesis C-methylase UbiE